MIKVEDRDNNAQFDKNKKENKRPIEERYLQNKKAVKQLNVNLNVGEGNCDSLSFIVDADVIFLRNDEILESKCLQIILDIIKREGGATDNMHVNSWIDWSDRKELYYIGDDIKCFALVHEIDFDEFGQAKVNQKNKVIDYIYTQSNFRRIGLAKKIIQSLKKDNCHWTSFMKNTASEIFFSKVGFHHIGFSCIQDGSLKLVNCAKRTDIGCEVYVYNSAKIMEGKNQNTDSDQQLNEKINRKTNKIKENIIKLLVRIDNVSKKRNVSAEDLSKCGLAIKNILGQVENDFGSEFMLDVFRISSEKLGHTLGPLDISIIKKLMSFGFERKNLKRSLSY